MLRNTLPQVVHEDTVQRMWLQQEGAPPPLGPLNNFENMQEYRIENECSHLKILR